MDGEEKDGGKKRWKKWKRYRKKYKTKKIKKSKGRTGYTEEKKRETNTTSKLCNVANHCSVVNCNSWLGHSACLKFSVTENKLRLTLSTKICVSLFSAVDRIKYFFILYPAVYAPEFIEVEVNWACVSTRYYTHFEPYS